MPATIARRHRTTYTYAVYSSYGLVFAEVKYTVGSGCATAGTWSRLVGLAPDWGTKESVNL